LVRLEDRSGALSELGAEVEVRTELRSAEEAGRALEFTTHGADLWDREAGSANVLVPTAFLTPGRYEVRVFAAGEENPRFFAVFLVPGAPATPSPH
jgi:hypothetical protein